MKKKVKKKSKLGHTHPWRTFVPKDEAKTARERGEKIIPYNARMGVRG